MEHLLCRFFKIAHKECNGLGNDNKVKKYKSRECGDTINSPVFLKKYRRKKR